MPDGRIDLTMGHGNTGSVYPWFGKDIRDGIARAIENYALLRELWANENVTGSGKFRTLLRGYISTPRPLDSIAPFVWHGSIRSPRNRRTGRLLRWLFLPRQHLLAARAHRPNGRPLPRAIRIPRPQGGEEGDRGTGRTVLHEEELPGRYRPFRHVSRKQAR